MKAKVARRFPTWWGKDALLFAQIEESERTEWAVGAWAERSSTGFRVIFQLN